MTNFRHADIVNILVDEAMCGIDKGSYQGTVIERNNELIVVLNDIELAMRSDVFHGHILELDWIEANAEVELLFG